MQCVKAFVISGKIKTIPPINCILRTFKMACFYYIFSIFRWYTPPSCRSEPAGPWHRVRALAFSTLICLMLHFEHSECSPFIQYYSQSHGITIKCQIEQSLYIIMISTDLNNWDLNHGNQVQTSALKISALPLSYNPLTLNSKASAI